MTINYIWDFALTYDEPRYESLYTLIKHLCFRETPEDYYVVGHGFIMDRIIGCMIHDELAKIDRLSGHVMPTSQELGENLIHRLDIGRRINDDNWSFNVYELNSLGDEVVLFKEDKTPIIVIKILNVMEIYEN